MQLYLLRHADADTIAETDEARALSEKGESQARKVGRFCSGHDLTGMRILSSPLRRAHQTAEIVARQLRTDFVIAPWLAAGIQPVAALERLRAFSEEAAVMIVGHEPDFSSLATHLLGLMSGARLEIRKASLTRLTVDAFEKGGARLDFFIPCRLM